MLYYHLSILCKEALVSLSPARYRSLILLLRPVAVLHFTTYLSIEAGAFDHAAI